MGKEGMSNSKIKKIDKIIKISTDFKIRNGFNIKEAIRDIYFSR